MKLKFYKAFYGAVGKPHDFRYYMPKLAEDGYDGAEQTISGYGREERDEIFELQAKHHLEFLPKLFTTGKSVAEHLSSLRATLEDSLEFKPDMVNVQSGRDFWEFEDQVRFFEEAVAMEKDYPFMIVHETHRFRAMNSPWATYRILQRVPELKIGADFSHFLVTSESDCSEFEDMIAYCCERAYNVHGRVSFEEAPQVPDPRAPEYEKYVAIFDRWWMQILDSLLKKGHDTFRFDPEYGVPTYETRLPYTRKPVSDAWEIANWAKDRFRKQFEECMALIS